MLYRVRPKVVIAIHTTSPHRLHPVGGPARVVVDYARRYDFAGRPVPGDALAGYGDALAT